MDRNYQDSLDQDMIQNKTHDSADGDGTDRTSDSHKRNRIHLFSQGTHHWQNIASLLAMYDIVAVNLSYFLALWFRFDCHFSSIPQVYLRAWQSFCPFYTVICLVVFWRLRMYRSIWRFASLGELNRIIVSSIITGGFHIIAITLLIKRMPVTYYVVGALLQFIFITLIRFSYRLYLLIYNRHYVRIVEKPINVYCII